MEFPVLSKIFKKQVEFCSSGIAGRIEMIQADCAEHIEKYAAAFLKETGCKAAEVMLIQREHFYGIGYEYELKNKETGEIKSWQAGASCATVPPVKHNKSFNFDQWAFAWGLLGGASLVTLIIAILELLKMVSISLAN